MNASFWPRAQQATPISGCAVATILSTWVALMLCCNARADNILPPPLRGIHKIVFLGDSITYSGQYIEYVDAVLAARFPNQHFELINLGLPSETVSGLSEPGHAGGAFPRPDLHERLDRVLAKTKPDMVVACYGMNDGIYFPFSEERFAKYRKGMTWLAGKVKAAEAKLLILTPPVFDAEPIRADTLPAGLDVYPKPYAGYDDVLDRYSEWLLDQRSKGWRVEDVHGPMRRHLDSKRRAQPAYRLADDGVHPNDTGHRLIAGAVLKAWRIAGANSVRIEKEEAAARTLPLIQARQRMLKDAWLTDVGHTRPGMAKGLPLADALQKAAEMDSQIRELARSQPSRHKP